MSTLEITLDAETKQRVEAAAAEKKVSVNDYVMTAVQRQLAKDSQLEVDRADVVQPSIYDADLLQEIDKLHAAILERRGGEPIDTDTIIELVRDS